MIKTVLEMSENERKEYIRNKARRRVERKERYIFSLRKQIK
ncbi:MAG: hypothetical protein ACRC1T_05540 [Clostridium chrysemydis]